ncbi:hypothetical protein L2E82_25917 [Cichorium intybus]|uniref:Uncharacterized protein n=1 Tax=Cichorium intybus TaxID=13427 RepID=A0ACB9E5G3_CICIN|nr:hypothetical protein L2E82_25917 [Cichorium intybus]
MLAASGVVQEFESDEGGAGITLFVPTDDAFSDLPASANFQSLPADKKADVLRFHMLHSYYPLGSLQSIVNPVQPTLATEDKGARSFTLNISRVNESVAINTGIIQASVTQTVFDQNPVAIFGISRVLLPNEIFGKNAVLEKSPPISGAPTPFMPMNYPPPELFPRLELTGEATRAAIFLNACSQWRGREDMEVERGCGAVGVREEGKNSNNAIRRRKAPISEGVWFESSEGGNNNSKEKEQQQRHRRLDRRKEVAAEGG